MHLSLIEEERVISAIALAEKSTSGEIRVHIDNHCKEDVLDHAAFVFNKLEMHKTNLRNGILIYIALKDKKFAIIGDAGINAKVPDNYWDNVKNTMGAYFSNGNLCEGLCKGISLVGEKLKEHYPYHEISDKNELSNNISFGN